MENIALCICVALWSITCMMVGDLVAERWEQGARCNAALLVLIFLGLGVFAFSSAFHFR